MELLCAMHTERTLDVTIASHIYDMVEYTTSYILNVCNIAE